MHQEEVFYSFMQNPDTTLDRTTLDHLYRYCHVLCGNRDDAFDLLHDALEKFLHVPANEVAQPVAYIRRIARNRFFDQLRRKRVLDFEVLEDPDVYASTERALEDMVLDQALLRQIWAVLSPAEREVLFLWVMEDMSASEIALHLNEPRGTVLSRMHRLRLRIALKFPEQIDKGGKHG